MLDSPNRRCYTQGETTVFFTIVKGEDTMNKKQYLKRFTWSACWQLPPEEAGDVLADYRELVEGSEEGELVKTLGKPYQAARLLRTNRTYFQWLAVFGVLMACALLPVLYLLGMKRMWHLARTGGLFLFFFVGAILLSLFWFRTRGFKGAHRPKTLFPALLAVLLAGAAVSAFMFWLFWYTLIVYNDITVQVPAQFAPVAIFSLRMLGVFSTLAGIFGLVKSRIEDRRWLALYILGFTVLFLCVSVYSLLTAMDNILDWIEPWRVQNVLLGIAGLVAAGAALC